MCSTTATSVPCSGTTRYGSQATRLWVGLTVLFFFLLYSSYFERLFRIVTKSTTDDGWLAPFWRLTTLQLNPDWAHVLVIPFLSLYFIYLHRHEVAGTPRRVYLPGLAVFLASIMSFIFWVFPGRNDMFQGISMVFSLLGMVLFLFGPSMLRILWFPLLYLLFTVKVADQWWDHFAWKLQGLAASGGALLLRIAGLALDMDAQVRGSTIDVWNHGVPLQRALDVAQACAGLRSLMAFVALGVAIAFIYRRPWWQRLVLIASTIPIAVLINMARVATVGILAAKINPSLAGGDFHITVGMLMLIPAAGLFLLLSWVMQNIFVPDTSAPSEDTPPPLAPVPASNGRPRDGLLGCGVGMLLASSLGLLYVMFWAVFQPQQIGLTTRMATMVAVLGMLSLALGLWLASRFIANSNAHSHNPLGGLGVIAGVLLAAWLGLGTMVRTSKLVLIKEPLPMRAELRRLPIQVQSWEMIQDTPPLSSDIIETLGTDQYIMRWYRDRNWSGAAGADLAVFHGTYYTGQPDTVPHVPDRCFVANGRRPVETRRVTLQLGGDGYQATDAGYWIGTSLLASQLKQSPPHLPSLTIPATIFRYEAPEHPGKVSSVIYFFVANGRFMASPIEVRKLGFAPWDRYCYYAKVEVELPFVGDEALAVERAGQFLSVMLPEMMSCLPDWELLKQR